MRFRATNVWIINDSIKDSHLLTNLPSIADFGIYNISDYKFKGEIVADPDFFKWNTWKNSFI
ncbi:hypothetical protein EG339_23890 [Chryseobacterium bernardetii]|uniref:Uncharacterized protein n=1 Tax=Chryseobacterium bernardetii TaxID=1241978 RepID=A0A3G6TDU3_9FLAO|nr:hypothetical protein EG339_23890 [Chryseobacterium bernardetii]